MKEKPSIESMGYNFCKYLTPSSLTASQTSKTKVVRARKRYMNAPLTYQLLLEEQERKVKFDGLNPQTAANRASALRSFMRSNGLCPDDVVGLELRRNYPEALQRFISDLQALERTSRAISNTRASLRPWLEAVVKHDTAQALEDEKPTPFMAALKSLTAEKNVALISRQADIPKDMLRGWLGGKLPRASNAKYIGRLEVYFGIQRNTLLQLSGIKPAGKRVDGRSDSKKPIEYRNIIGELTRIIFCVKPKPDSQLRAQWAALLTYKTSATLINNSEKKRTKRGKWRVSPCALTAKTDSNWWSFLPENGNDKADGKYKEVASARIAWGKTSAYLGWLRLSPEFGGPGMPEEQVETLAWLAVPDHIEAYLDWVKERVRARNQGATQFFAYIASLVRPEFGYLRQTPELQKTLPTNYQEKDWKDICDRTYSLTQALTAAYHDELEVTRDSFEPIKHILDMPQPLEAVADMIQRMRADRPVGNPRAEAIWCRDLVLIKILTSNPLRRRNLSHLTWRADNTGELHQREDKSWWIRIHKTKFKNTRGAAGEFEFYESQVQPSAWPDIEKYIRIHRNNLMREPTDLLFLTPSCGSRSPKNHQPWIDLGFCVKKLTARYLYKCKGIGSHAFRHIVATSILKASGGDYKTAALVLHDRAATVEKHYAFLKANDGANRMGELLGSTFNRM